MVITSRRILFLFATFALVLAYSKASFACFAICGPDISCTGQYCYCNGDHPVCFDEEQETVASLNAKAEYIRSFNTPGLDRFAKAAEKMADAIAQSDKDAYFIGVLEREDALKSLTAKERKILNSWNGGDSKPTEPREK